MIGGEAPQRVEGQSTPAGGNGELDNALAAARARSGNGWVARLLWTASWMPRLSPRQRRECGLSWWRLLVGPGNAYTRMARFMGVSYSQWVGTADALTPADRAAISAQIARWQKGPRFRVVLIGDADQARCRITVESLDEQLYQGFRVDDGASLADDEWLLLVRAGDRLAPHALYWFACTAMEALDAAIIYADDDEIEDGTRCRPRFKPDWSLTHLRETDYIGRSAIFNQAALVAAGGLTAANRAGDSWELLLRVGEAAHARVMHLPAVLLHRDAIQEGLAPPVRRRVRHSLPTPAPRVSIIVPTRDAASLLRRCVDSVLHLTSYPNYELLLVDNGSREPDALDLLSRLAQRQNVRVIRDDRPFNYSALNNRAAMQATGDVLCLMNNDVEVITPDWLEEMIGQLLQPGVGVVGAKLYYADGRVQHGGDVVGQGGCANHLHQYIARDDPGYCNRAMVAQDLSAVTAACFVTWRDLYGRLGGLNERWLPVAFNDVDYCLRVREAGYRVVWTPHAELWHHESASRGKSRGLWKEIRAWREARYMRWKWRAQMRADPFYNPNFSCLRADFALAPSPNVRKPWREDSKGTC